MAQMILYARFAALDSFKIHHGSRNAFR